MGSGATRGLHAVRWGVAGNIVLAWFFTIPMAGLVGALMEVITRLPAGDLIVFVLAVVISVGAFAARRWETRRLLPAEALESAPI
jgi:PiT family inorganic phosphate transporter